MLPSAVPALPRLQSTSVGEREPGIECATSSSCQRHIAPRRDDGRPPAHRSKAADGRPANEPRRGTAPTTLRTCSSGCPKRLHSDVQGSGPSRADSRPYVSTLVPEHPESIGATAAADVAAGDDGWCVARRWSVIASSHQPQHRMAHATRELQPTELDGLRQCRPSHDCLQYRTLRVLCPLHPLAEFQRTNGAHLTAFRGVLYPTTFAEAGSDPRRVCLTRLCCAFRFSQPLDALFRPQPSSLVSCR
jgi:hypothetical protein